MSLGRNIAGVFGSNFLNLFLSLGNSIFLTRILGVQGKGEFAVFSASFGLFSLLLGLGLDISLRYHVARGAVPRDRILSTVLVFALGAGLFLLGMAHLNHTLGHNELFLPRAYQTLRFELVLAGVLVSNLIYGNLSSVFAGSQSFATLNATSVGLASLSFVVFGLLYWLKAAGHVHVSIEHVFIAYLVLQILGAVLLCVLAYWRLQVRWSSALIPGVLVVDLIRYAGLAYVAALLQFLNYRVDVWIVQYFSGSEQLGLYVLGANLAAMLWMLPRSASTVLMPAMAQDGGTSEAGAARLGRLVLSSTMLLALPLALSSVWWIPLLYGRDFVGSAVPFVVLLVGSVPYALCILLGAALGARARLEVHLTAAGAGLVVTIVLDILLIPSFGIIGAAVASSVSYLVTTMVVVRAFARLGGLPLRACLIPQRGDIAYVIDGFKSVLR